jgi:sulfur-oxidizing protein SoxA
MRGAGVFLVLAVLAPPLGAQSEGEGLAIGRQMLAEDNPGELWVQRGEQLFHEKRGPGKASLERCDSVSGPAV